jgi:hypothetical protein
MPSQAWSTRSPARPAPQRIARFLARCQAAVAQPDCILSVCVTVPGLVRCDGFIVHLPILGWKNVGFLAMATERLGLPVLIARCAVAALEPAWSRWFNTAALAHYSRPACNRCRRRSATASCSAMEIPSVSVSFIGIFECAIRAARSHTSKRSTRCSSGWPERPS